MSKNVSMLSERTTELLTNSEIFQHFINNNKANEIANALSKFGRLPSNFSGTAILLKLLESSSKAVRLEAIKNIAKLADNSLVPHLLSIINKESEVSEIRREAVSAIGRMRSQSSVPILLSLLKDDDPNVILQAIRGLLIFKNNVKVNETLSSLAYHENEIIRKMIDTEFNKNRNQKEDYINHVESPLYMHNTVVHGDAKEVLKYVPNGSVHLTFTSPPYYNARDYSIYKSYDSYLDFLKTVFKEIHRITKEGRFFILNTSPIIIPRVGRSYSSKRYPIPYDLHSILVQMGWEFIDDIVWRKPEASAKNRVSGFNQHRKPLMYKPNCITESIMVYRKKTNKLIDWNIKQYDKKTIEQSLVDGEILTSNVWNIDPVSDKIHSATFPAILCDYIIKYYSFVNDLVFDPFGGSGTFGKVAIENNRKFFLTEMNDEYFIRIQEKISANMFLSCCPKFIGVETFKQYSDFKGTDITTPIIKYDMRQFMTTLADETTKKIILKLLNGEDYRIEVVELLNSTFLQYALDFFKCVIHAKLNNNNIDIDWYKKEFLNENLSSDDIATHAGLNKKTISNMYNSARREVVIEASNAHYDQLHSTLQSLVDNEDELELKLTIKFGQVSVELNISESLIVINALAVKRAALRGGLWSTAGKSVEKPLMITLCKLYGVNKQYYHAQDQVDENKNYNRETDFYLIGPNGKQYKCEVKLMGKGNPESADAVIARDSDIFIADKLSDTNKLQLSDRKIHWVELRSENGFHKIENILNALEIDHSRLADRSNYEKVINASFLVND